MIRFFLHILLYAFLVGTIPANAYTCHLDSDELPDNIPKKEMTDCHQTQSDNKGDIEKSKDKDCCDNDCSACFHTNAYVLNDLFDSIGHMNFKITFYSINPDNFFPDINTPPPNV